MRKFLASVGNAQLLGKIGGELKHIADVRTLTDSTLSFSNSMDEIRAGEGAQLYGRFAHDAGMTIQLTDAMFDINYVALQVGAELTAQNGEVRPMGVGTQSAFAQTREVTLTAGQSSVSLDFADKEAKLGAACGLDKYVVWYRLQGCGEASEWKAVTSDSKISSISGFDTYQENKTVCVKYMENQPNAKSLFVNANFIPAELVLILTTKLFAGDANAPETGKPVGEITVKIPRFQLDGQFDLSMAMSSPATTSLSGTALAVPANDSCSDDGIYAEIVEVMYDTIAFTGLKEIAIDSDSTATEATVYGLYADGHYATLADAVEPGDTTTPATVSLGDTYTLAIYVDDTTTPTEITAKVLNGTTPVTGLITTLPLA